MLMIGIFVAMATITAHAHDLETKTVLTYNTLLTIQYQGGQSENMAERRDVIVEGIRRVNADVVCLQEVWVADDVYQIFTGLQDVYGYSASLLHQEGSFPPSTAPQGPACPADTFGPYSGCMLASGCLGLTNVTQITACVTTNCGTQYLALPQKCIGCMAFIGLKNSTLFLEQCTGEAAVGKMNVNDPGLVILSKYPIRSQRFYDYQPGFKQVFRRGYIHAMIDGLGAVTCTHLSAIVQPYTEGHLLAAGKFTNFKDQNADEIDKLIDFVTKTGEPHILLGDFNTGPAIPAKNISAEFGDNYKLLTRRLTTTLLEACTFCWDNEYVNGQYPDMVIDHIFIVGHEGLQVTRVLDKGVVPSTDLPLSDHNGVLGTIEISDKVSSAAVHMASLPLMLVTTAVAYFLRKYV